MNPETHALPDTWLAAYYDGELDEMHRQSLEAHLNECISCRQRLAALQSLSQVLVVDALADRAVMAPLCWPELEARLAGRPRLGLMPLNWFPGIGLLLAHGVLQFGAIASAVVMLMTAWFKRDGFILTWLGRVLGSWILGWPAWWLPAPWSNLGLPLFFVLASAGLAVLYLAWLGYLWRYHRNMYCQEILGA